MFGTCFIQCSVFMLVPSCFNGNLEGIQTCLTGRKLLVEVISGHS